MAKQTGEFKHESLQDRETIVKYLNAISEGIRNGHLVLANGDEPIMLEPSGLLRLDLKAKRKEGLMKLSLKISWKEEEEVPNLETKPLIIGHNRE
jgi:amphi-Trp domain-containing protein